MPSFIMSKNGNDDKDFKHLIDIHEIEQNMDVNLYQAALAGDLPNCKVLLRGQIEQIENTEIGLPRLLNNILIVAAYGGHQNVCEWCIRLGANELYAALFYAVNAGRSIELLQLFVDHGADVTMRILREAESVGINQNVSYLEDVLVSSENTSPTGKYSVPDHSIGGVLSLS